LSESSEQRFDSGDDGSGKGDPRMTWFGELVEGLRDRVSGGRRAREMDEELAFHLDMETRKNMAGGMSPEEARRAALVSFGGVERFKEKTREEYGTRRFENLFHDVRFALRQLRKRPGFTVVATLTLALGIGATTLVFSVFNAVVLRPLPFEDADRLVRIRELTPQGDPMSVADANFLDFREQSRSFEEMVAVSVRPLVLSGDTDPVQLVGMSSTYGMFRMLGVTPVAGRVFAEDEFRIGQEPDVVLLGHGVWVREFGSDPAVVGRSIVLDGVQRTVLGVLPALDQPFSFDVWLPYAADPAFPRDDHRREVFARLAPGVTPDQARAGLNQIQARLGETFPLSNEGWATWIRTLPEWIVGPEVRRITQVLLGAVGLLLLLACVSVSNLLLARGTIRQREISLRAALGAGRSRLLSQMLVESLVLAVLGAGLGILLAYWALPVIQSLETTPLPRLDEISIDRTVLIFCTLAGLVSALVFGMAPALQGSKSDLMDLLRAGGRMADQGSQRLRDGLVAGQLALAMVLLVGAGLLISSFWRMTSADPGFDPERVLLVEVSLPGAQYPEMSPQVGAAFRQILMALESGPGVMSAGATMASPITGNRPANFVARSDQASEAEDFLPIQFRPVTPGFFEAMGLPLLRGGTFDELQVDAVMAATLAGEEAMVPAVLSRTLADRLWPEEDPVGKTMIWNQPGGAPMQVVGVVGDARDLSFPMDPDPMAYIPHTFVAWPTMTLVVQANGDLPTVANQVREAIWSLDPALPVPDLVRMETALDSALAAPRLNMIMMALFSASALLLAGIALYGITSFAVGRRTREIGVRMALGAPKREVARMVLARGIRLVVVGASAGLVGAVLLSRFLDALLFEVAAVDVLIYSVVTLLLGSVMMIATLLPVRRALKVDPTIALQAD
jgi:predicted permease